MDLTSGRWPRWVARYEKGGGQSTSGPIYEKWGGGGGGGGGGGIRFRSDTESGGGAM